MVFLTAFKDSSSTGLAVWVGAAVVVGIDVGKSEGNAEGNAVGFLVTTLAAVSDGREIALHEVVRYREVRLFVSHSFYSLPVGDLVLFLWALVLSIPVELVLVERFIMFSSTGLAVVGRAVGTGSVGISVGSEVGRALGLRVLRPVKRKVSNYSKLDENRSMA